MDILKVVSIGCVGCILYVVIKQTKPEFSVLFLIALTTLLSLWGLSQLSEVISFFNDLVNNSGISGETVKSIIKIVGIGWLSEFGAQLCDDNAMMSLGDRIRWVGKILIFIQIIPFLQTILEIIKRLTDAA